VEKWLNRGRFHGFLLYLIYSTQGLVVRFSIERVLKLKNENKDVGKYSNDQVQYVLVIISYVAFLAATYRYYPVIHAIIFPSFSIIFAIVGAYVNYRSTKKIAFNIAYVYLIFSSVRIILSL
jgi:hypothetical protein